MSNEIFNKLVTVMKDVKPSINISLESHLQDDLRLDSLDIMDFLFEIERTFEIKIPDSDIADNQLLKVDKMVNYIELKIAEKNR
jgi:acyl carrier protein